MKLQEIRAADHACGRRRRKMAPLGPDNERIMKMSDNAINDNKKTAWKRPFILVAAGQAVSMLGSHGVQFALIWWLAEQTSSPLMLGLSGLIAYLPMTLFSPVAGIAADRFNRKFISIFSDISMGVIALIYSLLLSSFDMPVWSVFIVLCARGIGSTFQQPAIQSIIPQLVPSDQLIKTNGWLQLINAGSFLLGPVISASLYAAFPLSVVLLSDVAGAVLASIALGFVTIPKLEKHLEERKSAVSEFKEGLLIFRKDEKLLLLVAAEALCMFFYAPLSSFYPLMTSDYFGLSAIYGSFVELAFAVGMLLSSLLFSSVLRIRRKIRTSFVGLLCIGVMSALCGIVPPTFTGWLAFALFCACLGASGNVHTIPLTAYIQETVQPEKMGRAFSVLTLISSVTMPIGLLISSPIAEQVGVALWFFISGIAIIVIFAAAMLIRLPWRRKRKSQRPDLPGSA